MIDKFNILAQALLGPRDDAGATAVEYGLMVALIAGVIAAAVTTLGTHVLASFQLMSGLWP